MAKRPEKPQKGNSNVPLFVITNDSFGGPHQ